MLQEDHLLRDGNWFLRYNSDTNSNVRFSFTIKQSSNQFQLGILPFTGLTCCINTIGLSFCQSNFNLVKILEKNVKRLAEIKVCFPTVFHLIFGLKNHKIILAQHDMVLGNHTNFKDHLLQSIEKFYLESSPSSRNQIYKLCIITMK